MPEYEYDLLLVPYNAVNLGCGYILPNTFISSCRQGTLDFSNSKYAEAFSLSRKFGKYVISLSGSGNLNFFKNLDLLLLVYHLF